MVHSLRPGVLRGVAIEPEIHHHLLEENPYLETGAQVEEFFSGGAAIGNLILEFDEASQMLPVINRLRQTCIPQLDDEYDKAV